MSGHYICEACGYDGGDHAPNCKWLRPQNEWWRGNRTREEMEELERRQTKDDDK